MANADKLLEAARAEIGYREGAKKDNKYGRWYGLNNAAWCVIFQQWVFAQAGLALPVKSASCSQLLNWYKANQSECVIPPAQASPGCLVIFDLPNTGVATDHIGLLESMSADYVTTIDGNTSGTNDANGGYVNRRTRAKKYVYAVIKPRELNEPQAAKMTGQEIYLALCDYLMKQKLPEVMMEEYGKAITNGITDGMNPCLLAPRWQAAVMNERLYEKLLSRLREEVTRDVLAAIKVS